MNFNLFISLYPEQDKQRRKELLDCLDFNESNQLIKHIHVLNEGMLAAKLIRCHERLIAHRVTYNDLFNFVNEYTRKDDINIIANSDIYFENTLELATKIKDNDCYAISRVGMPKNYKAGSQDVWIFKGRIRPIRADFPIGVPGCDNRLAHEIAKVGYDIINPCRTIKCRHLHKGKSWYDTKKFKKVPKPYKLVMPCEL